MQEEQAQTHLVAWPEGVDLPRGRCAWPRRANFREGRWIGEDEQVVALNTGTGVKYPEPCVPRYRLPRDGKVPAPST